MFNINFSWWLDLNREPLESEVTALPTEPQPLPPKLICLPIDFPSMVRWLYLTMVSHQCLHRLSEAWEQWKYIIKIESILQWLEPNGIFLSFLIELEWLLYSKFSKIKTLKVFFESFLFIQEGSYVAHRHWALPYKSLRTNILPLNIKTLFLKMFSNRILFTNHRKRNLIYFGGDFKHLNVFGIFTYTSHTSYYYI